MFFGLKLSKVYQKARVFVHNWAWRFYYWSDVCAKGTPRVGVGEGLLRMGRVLHKGILRNLVYMRRAGRVGKAGWAGKGRVSGEERVSLGGEGRGRGGEVGVMKKGGESERGGEGRRRAAKAKVSENLSCLLVFGAKKVAHGRWRGCKFLMTPFIDAPKISSFENFLNLRFKFSLNPKKFEPKKHSSSITIFMFKLFPSGYQIAEV